MTIHINIKIVGKHMLDKVLTGENVKVNGEIAGRSPAWIGDYKVFTSTVMILSDR
jgi:hypothetical protein